jgi:1,2-phenylacetyl-CoA epoxidase PaaB subunit
MAVTKIKPVKSTLSKALDYIENPDKTDGKMLISSFGCSYETADIEFGYTLSQALDKGSNLAFHLIQSFAPGEVDYEKAHEIGKQLADAVTKGQHEYVVTTHIDKGHIHNHVIFCAVNFVDHHKYNSNKRSYYGIRNMSDKLCRENGLSVVVPGKGSKGKSYAEYQAEKTGTSWKGKLKIAVDALIPQVSSFEELLTRLQAAGYEIKPGKYVSCRAPGQERFTRLKTLGADYTEEAIRERIAGRRAKAAKAPREQRGVSLLIDIENSIKAAQSKGYEQWAKIHNLKQAAKTMNFLTEHKIEQYADLVSRIEEMSAESGQAADALKNAEKRLADMAVLIKNVSTYQKTKPVYDAYRKARNREKYRAGQEQAIILHEAAARSLKAAGIAKLPNLAALQSEYEALQAQKEALYADYGKLEKESPGNMILSSRTLTAFYRQTGSRNVKREQSADKDSKIPAAVL